MKKRLLFLFICLINLSLFAQNNVTVSVDNNIYTVIENAQLRGLCTYNSSAKPFTQKKIISILNEILLNKEKLSQVEIDIINQFIEEANNKTNKFGSSYFEFKDFKVPVSFGIFYALNSDIGVGIYNKSQFNSIAFDFAPNASITGDIGDSVGFNFTGDFNFSKTPLYKKGSDYWIGDNWFPFVDETNTVINRGERIKTICSFENNAWLPYTHIYSSAGEYHWITNIIPSSFGSWTKDLVAYGNFYSEIHAGFLNDRLNIGFGRMTREWAAMDKNSSLVLNRTAVPFYAFDLTFDISNYLSYSFLTGNLENPRRPDIFSNATSLPDDFSSEDSYYFQNSFSLQMLEFNYSSFHIDLGTSVVYPKRFEFGYMFPLTVLAEYQNHVGDYDNVGMFGDIKYTLPGIGSVWASLFSDEINDFKTNPFSGTREMFALQGGIKAVIPNVPFGELTFRYTKVEPYCYTHHSINYVPYYNHYICENYSNNGICIGSYLPPNCDEFLLRFDCMPLNTLQLSIAYQLTRHGADFGTQQVRGSSIYSELNNKDRDYLYKYFLHDGAYNWIHALSANCTYLSKDTRVPFKVDFSLGLLISYYTGIDDSLYNTKDSYGNSNVNFNTPYFRIDTDEYPFKIGPLFAINFTIGRF